MGMGGGGGGGGGKLPPPPQKIIMVNNFFLPPRPFLSLAGQTLAHGEKVWYFTVGRLVLLSQLSQVYS